MKYVFMLLSLALSHPPILSLLTALTSRILSIAIKSRMALDGLSAMDKIEAVTLGIVVQPDEIQGWFRLMSHSLAHSLQLKSLSIVWINAPESFETIVNGNARICRDAAKIDLIIDMSSYASWLSVAEI